MSFKTIAFTEITDGEEAITINVFYTESAVFATDQRITLDSSVYPGITTVAIVDTGAGFIVLDGAFVSTDTGTITFLDFPTEVLEPDKEQPVVRDEDNSLTTYGENYLFELKTSLDEVKAFLQETYPL
jgi:hypothetical protein